MERELRGRERTTLLLSELNLRFDTPLGCISDTERSLANVFFRSHRSGYVWFDWANKKYDVRSPLFPSFIPPSQARHQTSLSSLIHSRSLSLTPLSLPVLIQQPQWYNSKAGHHQTHLEEEAHEKALKAAKDAKNASA